MDVVAARDIVAHHLLQGVVSVRAHERVRQFGDARRNAVVLDPVFVLDAHGALVGVCPLGRVLSASPEETFASLMEPARATVLPSDDQAKAALLAVEHRLAAVAVVDVLGRFMGAVPTSALLEILYHEHTEDLHRLAGIHREVSRAQAAIEAPPLRRARDRLPWLLVGLAGSSVATYVMSSFEHALSRHIALAFFVPAIVYIADAMGTQTEAIAVRGLSMSRASIGQLLRGEVTTGLIVASVLASLMFVFAAFSFGDVPLAATVALAIFFSGGVAAAFGLGLPWLLQRMNIDPAFGSGPLATIMQDVVSICIYFGIATWLC